MTHYIQKKDLPLGVDLDKKSIENTNLTLKDEIELCNQWLALCTEVSNKWTISTSYHFKHLVERHFGLGTYVSNDAFIIAAQRRYESKPADKEGLNYYFKFKVKDTNENCRRPLCIIKNGNKKK